MMEYTRTLLVHNTRKVRTSSVEGLIVSGLNYCCEAAFWRRLSSIEVDLIAARLGVTEDTIRRHKLWYRNGQIPACPLLK